MVFSTYGRQAFECIGQSPAQCRPRVSWRLPAVLVESVCQRVLSVFYILASPLHPPSCHVPALSCSQRSSGVCWHPKVPIRTFSGFPSSNPEAVLVIGCLKREWCLPKLTLASAAISCVHFCRRFLFSVVLCGPLAAAMLERGGPADIVLIFIRVASSRVCSSFSAF